MVPGVDSNAGMMLHACGNDDKFGNVDGGKFMVILMVVMLKMTMTTYDV